VSNNERCPQCGLRFLDESFSATPLAHGVTPEKLHCPNCGNKLETQAPYWESGGGIIRQYFRELFRILTNPTQFFRHLPLTGGLGRPLAFALATHWIGSAIGYLWGLLITRSMGISIGGTLSKLFEDVADVDSPGRSAQLIELKERAINWFWGAGSVIADPFFTLLKILFTSALVYIGARILVTPSVQGGPREISYESSVRIICFGMGPSILMALPIFGGPVSALLVIIVTIIGAREVYRVGFGRAATIALFPQVLFFGVFIALFAFLLLAVFKIMAPF
jgi:ribosomal protein S27AE